MAHYFDASYLIPLIRREPFSDRVAAFAATIEPSRFVTSFWTLVECRSALAREVRMGRMTLPQFANYCGQLDNLIINGFRLILPVEEDYRHAAAMIEAPQTGLRSGDAVHLAVARRLDVELLLTLDRKMISIGKAYGIRAGSGFDHG